MLQQQKEEWLWASSDSQWINEVGEDWWKFYVTNQICEAHNAVA